MGTLQAYQKKNESVDSSKSIYFILCLISIVTILKIGRKTDLHAIILYYTTVKKPEIRNFDQHMKILIANLITNKHLTMLDANNEK